MNEPPQDDLGFSYRTRKSGDVEVLRDGVFATLLRGLAAARFLAHVETCAYPEAQQLMARVTGNYKHGNERVAGRHPRNPQGAGA